MDHKEIVARVEAVINDTRAGLLTTIGLDGRPNVRWMATHTLVGALDLMYTITGPQSNKAKEIARNANVTWLFSRVNFTEIAKLYGTATLEDDPLLKSQVWDIVGKRTYRYFTLNREQPVFSVLVTRILEIEYLAPGKQIFEPLRVRLREE